MHQPQPTNSRRTSVAGLKPTPHTVPKPPSGIPHGPAEGATGLSTPAASFDGQMVVDGALLPLVPPHPTPSATPVNPIIRATLPLSLCVPVCSIPQSSRDVLLSSSPGLPLCPEKFDIAPPLPGDRNHSARKTRSHSTSFIAQTLNHHSLLPTSHAISAQPIQSWSLRLSAQDHL